jgi:hypothetical protein
MMGKPLLEKYNNPSVECWNNAMMSRLLNNRMAEKLFLVEYNM